MIPNIRTTSTIKDDLAGILRQKARTLDMPFKEVVNSALRKGLAVEMEASPQRVVVKPHDFGASRGIDPDRMNQLSDELEVKDYLRKAGRNAAS